jgi:hypothetical protein
MSKRPLAWTNVVLAAFLWSTAVSAQANQAEIFPVETRSVPPSPPSAIPPQGIPPSSYGPTPEQYGPSEREHEWLQQFAITDPSAPLAGQVVSLASNPAATPATITTSFAGLDYPASLSYPPDTTVAKSSLRVLEATNSSLRLFNTSGSALATTSTASMFGVSTGMTDPKVFFDNNSTYPRFVLLVEDTANVPSQTSNLYLAVSRTSNPSDFTSSNWCTYWLGGSQTLNGVNTFYDSPIFGVGADTLVYSTNQYSFSNGTYQGAIVNAGSKQQIENNAAACPWIGFYVFVPTPTDNTTFALMPAQHYTNPSSFSGTTNPVYMISTHHPTMTETSSSIYRVWRVRNVVSGAAALDELDVTVSNGSYSTSPPAPQLSGGFIIDEGDPRVKQIAGIGDSLWLTLGTTCSVNGANQGCIRVLDFGVGQDAGGHLTAYVAQSFLFSGAAGVHYWMPAIAATSNQSTIVVFLTSSSSTYLSSAFTTKTVSASFYPAATALFNGGCANGIRDGDYQGAQTNPGDLASFWIAGEATPPAGQCSALWQTKIANVTP